MEASVVQSLRQESSVQESDSSVRSGSLIADNPEESKDHVDSEEEGAMESFQMTKLNWMNVLFLGGGFFLLFTAFQTTAFVQVTTLRGSDFVGIICTRVTLGVVVLAQRVTMPALACTTLVRAQKLV